LNIRFAAGALRRIDHFFTIRRNIKIVKIGPYRAGREKGLGRNNSGEPNIEQRRIGRKEVTHVSLRHVMARITKKDRRGGDWGKGKRSVGHRVGRITKEILGGKNGVNESETR